MPAIVYSGSGLLFPAHWGATQAIIDRGFQFHKSQLVGTSGGSIAASMLSGGLTPQKCLEILCDNKPTDLISFNKCFWQPFDCIGLFNLNKFEKILKKYIPKTFAFSKHDLTVVATNITTQKTQYFSTENTPLESLPKTVVASCSVPFLFVPVEIKQQLYVDGGVTNNFAVDYPTIDDVIGIRLLSTNDELSTEFKINAKKITNRFDYISAMLGCMMKEIEKKHIEDAKFARIITIRLPFHPFDFYNIGKKEFEAMYKIGYDITKAKLAEKPLF